MIEFKILNYIETFNHDIYSIDSSSESGYSTDLDSKQILRNNNKLKKIQHRTKKKKKTIKKVKEIKKETDEFNKTKYSPKWSALEEFKLIQIVGDITDLNKLDWTEIVKKFNNRTVSALKSKYQSLIKNSIPPERVNTFF